MTGLETLKFTSPDHPHKATSRFKRYLLRSCIRPPTAGFGVVLSLQSNFGTNKRRLHPRVLPPLFKARRTCSDTASRAAHQIPQLLTAVQTTFRTFFSSLLLVTSRELPSGNLARRLRIQTRFGVSLALQDDC